MGVSATGLAGIAGIIGLREIAQGVINHAIYIATVYPRKYDVFSYPAKRSDGFVDNVNAIPEGMRLRMDPTINFDTQYTNLHPLARQVAKAMQKYGGIIADKAGSVTVQGESARNVQSRGGVSPWPGLFGNTAQIMANFPWDKVQALPFDYGKP